MTAVGSMVLHGECYKGLAPPRSTTKRRITTINPSDLQSAQLTDQAPGTIGRAAHGSSRMTTTSTATPSQHHTDPAASSPESSQPTQHSARRRRAEPHYYADTSRTSGDSRSLPPGGPVIRRNWCKAPDARRAIVGGGGVGGEGRRGGYPSKAQGKGVGGMR